MGLEGKNLAASDPCMNTLLGGKIAFSSLHPGQSNQFAYVLSPPAIAAVQEPCTGVIHHLPVYPIQLRNNDVSSVLLPVMESAAKNIVNYLNVAQSISPKSPQVLPPAPHFLQEDAPPQPEHFINLRKITQTWTI
uniref:Uncharacterized protein n=1 Tax=Acrobeloides nanus TaxID=290746 RepID=A0A914CS34_9BILA